MVKIRLKRMGTTKRPVYRLVVADSRSPRDGRFIELIGFYDPLPNPAVVTIDTERVQLWLRRGARPSDSARQLLVKEGILAARPFKITPRVRSRPGACEARSAKLRRPRRLSRKRLRRKQRSKSLLPMRLLRKRPSPKRPSPQPLLRKRLPPRRLQLKRQLPKSLRLKTFPPPKSLPPSRSESAE